MAAPTIAGTPTDNAATGGSVVVTKPTGTTTGDVLICIADIYEVGFDPAATTATGFTQIGSVFNNNGVEDHRMTVLYRVVDGSEGASFTVASSTGNDYISATIFRVTGANTSSPIDASQSGTSTAANSAVPQVTTTGADRLVISVKAGFNNTTWSTPSGWTLSHNYDSGFCEVWYKTQASAGVTGTATSTHSADTVTSFTIAISPASTATTGSMAVTQAAQTSTVSGTISFSGSMAVTQAAQTGAFSGSDNYAGTMAVTQAAQTSTASGTNTPPTLTGSMAVTQAAQTSSMSGYTGTGLWPTTVDGTNKRFLDQNGDPWYGVGDTAWSLIGQLSQADITTYLTNIAAEGVNLVLMSAPEPYYTDNTPAYRNAAGADPFTGTVWQSAINDTYWQTVDHAVETALGLGITLLIVPQYLGFVDDDGWRDEITTAYGADPQNLTDYGIEIAARYAPYPNIMWMIGHDTNPTATAQAASILVADELRSGTSHLITAGGSEPTGTGIAEWSGSGFTFDFDTVYDYDDSPGQDTASARTTITTIFLEGKYEQEQSIGIGAQLLREQVWEPFCAGAAASIFGNNPRWHFESGKEIYSFTGTWQNSITNGSFNDGTVHLGYLADFIAAVDCLDTLPDTTGTFLTSGTGFARFDTAIGVAYQTAASSITLDTTELAGTGNVRIRRYDPTDGSFTTVTASEAQSSSRSISHAGSNAGGGNDWVYVVDLTTNVSGTMAVTQAAQTSTISGTISFSGTMAVTQAAQTSTITGVESFTGTTATTQAAQTMTASGLAGSSPTGSMAVTQADQTSTISGTITFTGSMAVTQAAQTMTASGIAGSNPTAVMAATQADQTSTISGTITVTFTATMAVTQAAQTMTASGTDGSVVVVIYGPALTYNPPPILTHRPPSIITGRSA